jgi:hypothetical protein
MNDWSAAEIGWHLICLQLWLLYLIKLMRGFAAGALFSISPVRENQ